MDYTRRIDALNAIATCIGGSGGHSGAHGELAAWQEIASVGLTYNPADDAALDLFYTARSGNTLTESKSSLNARILPAVFKGNNSGYYDYQTAAFYSSDDWVLNLELEFTTAPSSNNLTFFSQGGNLAFRIASDNRWYFAMSDGTNNRNITILNTTLAIQARKYVFKIVHDKDGATTIYEGGVSKGAATGTFGNLATAGSAKYNYFGYNGASGNLLIDKANLISASIYSDIAETTLVAKFNFTGDASAYDVSGNNRHLTGRSIIAANKSYSANGSLYRFDYGYTVWEKAASADIIAPYGVTTSPIAAGYTIARVFPGSATKMNFADALIGFNETGSADTKLNIFDRSNTTIQTAASRSSAYYDSTSLATKSRFHTSELAPYEKILTWYNTDYQDRVFGNLSKLTTDFSLTEIFVSSAKKTGSTLAKVKAYCHIDGIYYVGSTNNFRTIQRAVTYAYAGNTLNIATGSYNELIDLSTKLLHLVGNGTLETIINYVTATSAPDHVLKIGTVSTFTNIVADHEETTTSGGKAIVYVNNANPVFTNCKIGQNYYSNQGQYKSLRPILFEGTSQVTLVNTDIIGMTGIFGVIKDTATLNMTGGNLKAHLNAYGDSVINATVNEIFATANPLGTAIILEGNNVSNFIITGQNRQFNSSTGAQVAEGIDGSWCWVHDNVELTVSGVNMYKTVIMGADAVNTKVRFNNLTTDRGNALLTVDVDAAPTNLFEINDSHIVHDMNNDVDGRHLYEDAAGIEININDSYLEWTGHQGNWFTMGSPLYGVGGLTMKRSTLVDNIDDSTESYLLSISTQNFVDLEDCKIILQNSIGVPYNIIVITPLVGVDFHVKIKDTSFTNGNVAGTLIYVNWLNRKVSPGDWIHIEGLTKDANIALFQDSLGSGMTMYNQLVSQYPG